MTRRCETDSARLACSSEAISRERKSRPRPLRGFGKIGQTGERSSGGRPPAPRLASAVRLLLLAAVLSAGIKYKDIATITGCSEGWVSRVFAGYRGVPPDRLVEFYEAACVLNRYARGGYPQHPTTDPNALKENRPSPEPDISSLFTSPTVLSMGDIRHLPYGPSALVVALHYLKVLFQIPLHLQEDHLDLIDRMLIRRDSSDLFLEEDESHKSKHGLGATYDNRYYVHGRAGRHLGYLCLNRHGVVLKVNGKAFDLHQLKRLVWALIIPYAPVDTLEITEIHVAVDIPNPHDALLVVPPDPIVLQLPVTDDDLVPFRRSGTYTYPKVRTRGWYRRHGYAGDRILYIESARKRRPRYSSFEFCVYDKTRELGLHWKKYERRCPPHLRDGYWTRVELRLRPYELRKIGSHPAGLMSRISGFEDLALIDLRLLDLSSFDSAIAAALKIYGTSGFLYGYVLPALDRRGRGRKRDLEAVRGLVGDTIARLSHDYPYEHPSDAFGRDRGRLQQQLDEAFCITSTEK